MSKQEEIENDLIGKSFGRLTNDIIKFELNNINYDVIYVYESDWDRENYSST